MLPILTTQRDILPFDFVPVNIVQEDAKGNPVLSFDNKNFDDDDDVPLVPAGSNTRIQVCFKFRCNVDKLAFHHMKHDYYENFIIKT